MNSSTATTTASPSTIDTIQLAKSLDEKLGRSSHDGGGLLGENLLLFNRDMGISPRSVSDMLSVTGSNREDDGGFHDTDNHAGKEVIRKYDADKKKTTSDDKPPDGPKEQLPPRSPTRKVRSTENTTRDGRRMQIGSTPPREQVSTSMLSERSATHCVDGFWRILVSQSLNKLSSSMNFPSSADGFCGLANVHSFDHDPSEKLVSNNRHRRSFSLDTVPNVAETIEKKKSTRSLEEKTSAPLHVKAPSSIEESSISIHQDGAASSPIETLAPAQARQDRQDTTTDDRAADATNFVQQSNSLDRVSLVACLGSASWSSFADFDDDDDDDGMISFPGTLCSSDTSSGSFDNNGSIPSNMSGSRGGNRFVLQKRTTSDPLGLNGPTAAAAAAAAGLSAGRIPGHPHRGSSLRYVFDSMPDINEGSVMDKHYDEDDNDINEDDSVTVDDTVDEMAAKVGPLDNAKSPEENFIEQANSLFSMDSDLIFDRNTTKGSLLHDKLVTFSASNTIHPGEGFEIGGTEGRLLGSWEDTERLDSSRRESSIKYDPWKVKVGPDGKRFSFHILGTSIEDIGARPHVLSPPLMHSLQGHLPTSKRGESFWLKYSARLHGGSQCTFLEKVRGSKYTVMAMETVDGEVFGAFLTEQWKVQRGYFGGGESFLWRLREQRKTDDDDDDDGIKKSESWTEQTRSESDIEVFKYSLLESTAAAQMCHHDCIAVGGGSCSTARQISGIGGNLSGTSSPNSTLPDASDRSTLSAASTITIEPQHWGWALAFDGGDMFECSSAPSVTFQSPSLSVLHPDGSKFDLINLEVWSITPCITVELAQSLERMYSLSI